MGDSVSVTEPSAADALYLSSARHAVGKLANAGRRVGFIIAFGMLPALAVAATLALAADTHFAFDFEQFWGGARNTLHGESPYPSPSALPSKEDADALSPEEVQRAFGFPYPAQAALALAPFAALPFAVAAALFTALLLAAGALTLWLLDVRDLRCYGVFAAWVPVLSAIRLGALTLLLAALTAAAWRYRERPAVAGVALGAAVAAKLFLWPALVWLLVTRRFRAAAIAVAAIGATTLATWPLLGLGWVSDYARLLNELSDAMEGKGYSTVALLLSAGAPEEYARLGALVLGLAAVAAVPVLRRQPHGDQKAFVGAIAAGFLLSPIVWLHYFALLVVPVAMARRRLSALWLLPLAFWLWPRFFDDPDGAFWQIGFGAAIVTGTLVVAVRVAGASLRSPASGPASCSSREGSPFDRPLGVGVR